MNDATNLYPFNPMNKCAGDFMVKGRKKKTGKEQVDSSYQPGNIGSMAGTLPSVKKKKK